MFAHFFGAFGSKLTDTSVLAKTGAFPDPASIKSPQHSNYMQLYDWYDASMYK